VVLKKTAENEQSMRRQVACFEIFAEFGIFGGDGDDFVVACARVDHRHYADSSCLNERKRLDWFLAKNEDIEGIVVFGIRLRDEAVVCRIKNGGMNDAVDLEQAGRFVELIFDVGAERNFNDSLEIAGNFGAGGNVMPCVNHRDHPSREI